MNNTKKFTLYEQNQKKLDSRDVDAFSFEISLRIIVLT